MKQGISFSLTENDIMGTALNGIDPATLKIPELKRQLKASNALTKGRKAELTDRWVFHETCFELFLCVDIDVHQNSYFYVHNVMYMMSISSRVQAYIRSDWSNNVVDPDSQTIKKSLSLIVLCYMNFSVPSINQDTLFEILNSSCWMKYIVKVFAWKQCNPNSPHVPSVHQSKRQQIL